MFLRASNLAIQTDTPTLSHAQLKLDSFTESVSNQAGTSQTLIAITMGSLFYQIGRVGTLALASQVSRFAPALNLSSYGIGLGCEVLAFEGTNRALETLSENHTNTNLWNWNGNGGWREGFTSTLFTLGSLKAFGNAFQNQHFLIQHFSSDLGMVGSQNALGILGWAPAPQGNILEQLAHAEVTCLQLAAGGHLLHMIAPGIRTVERNLNVSNSVYESSSKTITETTDLLPRMSSHRRKPGDPEYTEGQTIIDPMISRRMANTAESAWAKQFEKLWQRGGVEVGTESILRYLRYKTITNPAPVEDCIYNGERNIELELMQVLVRRGVSLNELTRAPTSSLDVASEHHARVFDMSELGISEEDAIERCGVYDLEQFGLQRIPRPEQIPQQPPREVEGSTMAVSATGIFQMLEGVAKPNAIVPLPNPSPTVTVPPIGLFRRAYNATLGRLVVKSSTSTIAESPRLIMKGPFILDTSSGTYHYHFPRGSLPLTIGRGWTADHKISGDKNLSRKHATIMRKMGPEGTFYEITGHSLTVIHQSAGGQTLVDHNQRTWLNPRDLVQLTPHISFIFDPEN